MALLHVVIVKPLRGTSQCFRVEGMDKTLPHVFLHFLDGFRQGNHGRRSRGWGEIKRAVRRSFLRLPLRLRIRLRLRIGRRVRQTAAIRCWLRRTAIIRKRELRFASLALPIIENLHILLAVDTVHPYKPGFLRLMEAVLNVLVTHLVKMQRE